MIAKQRAIPNFLEFMNDNRWHEPYGMPLIFLRSKLWRIESTLLSPAICDSAHPCASPFGCTFGASNSSILKNCPASCQGVAKGEAGSGYEDEFTESYSAESCVFCLNL